MTPHHPGWLPDRNPFITGFEGVPTDELIRLHNLLSGGYWLGQVRRTLNLRTVWEREVIRRGVDPHSWDVISGEVRR
jgi:hypothetical protein